MANDPSQTTRPVPNDILAAAKSDIREHLPEVARDLLVWRDTGTLPDGKFREIAAPLRAIVKSDHLGLAHKLANDAALEAVSGKRT